MTSTTGLRALQNVINGEHKAASDGRTSEVIDPTNGRPYAEAPISGQADIDAAMDAAAAAFEKWRETTPSERQQALLKIADAIEARADEIVKVESENTGKPIGLTTSEELPPGDRPESSPGCSRATR
jgi:betaine-aldehyde dehydrogenase